MMKEKTVRRAKKAASIFRRILVPLLLVAVLQMGLLYALMTYNGVFNQLRENAMDILSERTQNKHQSLQSTMTGTWANLSATADSVNKAALSVLDAQSKTWTDIAQDAQLNAAIVEASSEELIRRLRSNGTTGIFLILDGCGVAGDANTYAGFYVRDSDPTSETSDDSDLHMMRGLPPLSRALGLSLDSFWKATFSFEGGADNENNAYFFNPLNQAKAGGSKQAVHFSYWSHIFKIDGDQADNALITYSMPLMNDDGFVYGVLGVELSENYLVTVLNEGEFARSERGCYMLAITTDGGHTFEKIATGGAKYKQYFGAQETTLVADETDDNGSISVQSTRVANEKLRGTVFSIQLYNPNTAFESQQWVLIGLQDETSLFAFSNQFQRLVMIAIVTALALSVVVSVFVARSVVKPISDLVHNLRTNKPSESLMLKRSGTAEIDMLSDAITTMNREVAESASRISKLIELSGLPLGVYEWRTDADTAYCSDGFFELLEVEKPADGLMQGDEFRSLMKRVMSDSIDEGVYHLNIGNGERYIRINRQVDAHGVIGAILDITSEIEDRRRIEHERDYDLLTGILNRRAFERALTRIFSENKEQLGVGVLLMMDLDNLKFLNDAYGHDCGDEYIRTFAKAIRVFEGENAMVARRSGDEFYVFLYGMQDKEEARERVRRGWISIIEQAMMLPDQSRYRIRASGGMAWYPDDTANPMQLIHYADFAMYQVKHSSKGSVEEFNRGEYSQDSILFNGREALDRLIDDQLVRYMFQPIVSARTGKVYGYELLMRSKVKELPTPNVVIRMAKSQGKLQYIERITWMKGLETAQQMEAALPSDCKIFLNSIANQVISADDEQEIVARFGELLPRLMLEVTEGEDNNMAFTGRKLAFVRAHGGGVAIDDYGTGYNSELALVKIQSDVVKLDISFVRGVDADKDKQTLIRNLISFARQRDISVLAEGVETSAEMRTLIDFGVDYMQGYYLSRPQYDPPTPPQHVVEEIIAYAAQRRS